jgi:integrase
MAPGELRLRPETTKNRTERIVPLAPALLDLLREYASEREQEGGLQAGELIFTSPWGHAWGLSHNFRDWLDTVLERAGIERKDAQGRVVNVHALRHTFADAARPRGGLAAAGCLPHRTPHAHGAAPDLHAPGGR